MGNIRACRRIHPQMLNTSAESTSSGIDRVKEGVLVNTPTSLIWPYTRTFEERGKRDRYLD
jgi:hypothetical protein